MSTLAPTPENALLLARYRLDTVSIARALGLLLPDGTPDWPAVLRLVEQARERERVYRQLAEELGL
jgi:hypothetical protein